MSDQKVILCVEDDESSLLLLKAYVKTLGEQYAAVTATSGQECLDFVHQNHVDLIILDYVLGDMDGSSVCQHIASTSVNPEVPIIIVSMIDSDIISNLHDNSNVSKISRKPYTLEQFEEDIEELFADS